MFHRSLDEMKALFRFISYALLTFLILATLIGQLEQELPETDRAIAVTCEDGFEVVNSSGDRGHQRSWDMKKTSLTFCTSYKSIRKTSTSAMKRRDEVRPITNDYLSYWGSVYQSLVTDSRSNLGFLVDSLLTISKEKQLSREHLAELVVTFIQDIPYSYILNQPCETYDTKGKPCLGNVDLGILSPYEFIHTLYGDCDTRAVIIYALLAEMGFDPMIVVSKQYAHAMLALNIRASGDHIKHQGNNYYFWETTAKDWPIGMLPPSTNNINYWKIALVNGR